MAEDNEVPFRIFPGFAVPFVETEMPGAQPHNAALRELFQKKVAEGDAWRNPSPTMASSSRVFESRFDLFQWPEAPVQALQKFCTSALFKVVQQLNGYDRSVIEELRMTVDAWFHISKKGHSFGLHNHPMASWSGVYCVDSGYGDADPESGELLFAYPVPAAGMFKDLGVAKMPNPWGVRPRGYFLRPGQLVLFPSWIMHQVLPFEGEGERITVAFNAWFSRPGAAAA